MALLSGGGYAEYASVHKDLLMHIPEQWSMTDAAAIPEVFLTAFQALSFLSRIKTGESILIHAGASGVGTALIQICRHLGVGKIIVTASGAKHDICYELGADIAIDYKKEDFEGRVLKETSRRGVDVVIDFIAAPYFLKNLSCLALDGRMVLLALIGGSEVSNVPLALLLRKRLQIMGSTLRSRDLDYRTRLTDEFEKWAAPLFAAGKLRPVIDKVLPWTEVAQAHRMMESNLNKGKIILTVRD